MPDVIEVLFLGPDDSSVVQSEVAATVLEVSFEGPPGKQGVIGPPGGQYVFTQNTPSDTWAITHNLGFHPSAVVTDSSGQQVYGDASYPDLNSMQISFSAPFSGRADLT